MLKRIAPMVRAGGAACLLAAFALAILFLLPTAALAAPDAPGAVYLPVTFGNYAAPPGPSSFSLIDEAVAKGEIDAETGLVYAMYALFQDPRLPAKYRGNNSNVREAEVQTRVLNQWSSLKQSTRDLLEPFMIPPIYAGSWFDLRYSAGQSATVRPAGPSSSLICDPKTTGWNSIKTLNGKARIWWNSRWPADKARAEAAAVNIDARVWAALVEIHGAAHQPVSDQGSKCGGPDDALDIYITPLEASGYFMALPEYWARPNNACLAEAGQLQLANDESGDEALAGLIHELMHAFNHSYAHAQHCSEFNWLDESTAEWAVDYVDPKNDDEHFYAGPFLQTPDEPLESTAAIPYGDSTISRAYGAYLFPFYLNRYRGGQRQVGDIWTASITRNSLEAVDAVAQGGFKETWPQFALKNWNAPPVDDYTRDDKMGEGPKLHYPPEQSAIAMQGQGDLVRAVPSSEINHLAARYFHFTFNDPNVRSVMWHNGITANLAAQPYRPGPGLPYHGDVYLNSNPTGAETKGAHVWAIYKLTGRTTWEPPQNWTQRMYAGFCRDVTAERITDLVLVYSNSEWQDRTYKLDAPGEEPLLYMSNIGCWRWEGKATYETVEWGTQKTKVEVDVVWERQPNSGQFPVPALYRLVSGKGTWSVSGTFFGCAVSGSGSFTLDPNNPAERPTMEVYERLLKGPARRAYTGSGASAHVITYLVACPQGSHNQSTFVGAWWEPPAGLDPEPTFKTVKDDGVTIEDSETRTEGVKVINETRSLKAKAQP